MNVLDIDLDFFLDGRITGRLPIDRPSVKEYSPWTSDRVEAFLIERCGLDSNRPLPGAIVEEHHELFEIWKKLIVSNRLSNPFDLVHVDAHADMGMGDGSPSDISTGLLNKEVDQRTSPSGLLPGNYVAYAIACRWIRSFTYIIHPKLRKNFHDIPDLFFKNNNPDSDYLQFKELPPTALKDYNRLKDCPPSRLEPELPIRLLYHEEFTPDPSFSFLFVAKSPRYTPRSADRLLGTLSRFIISSDC